LKMKKVSTDTAHSTNVIWSRRRMMKRPTG
jgi:hypothetical protein